MGWLFRRRIKLLPGVHLNVGKSGFTSVNVGVRGASVTLGKRGVTQTLGIPGTGLSSRTKVSRRLPNSAASARPQTSVEVLPAIDPTRFGLDPKPLDPSAGRLRLVVLSGGVVCVLIGLANTSSSLVPIDLSALTVIGLAGIAIGLILMPSRASLTRSELARCQEVARAELTRRLGEWRAAVGTVAAIPTRETVNGLLTLKETLCLTNEEAGDKNIEHLQGLLTLFDAEAAAVGGQLQALEGHDEVVAPDDCFFHAESVVFDKRGDRDPSGSLYLTNARLIFLAKEGLTTAPWSRVVTVSSEDRSLRIQRRDRQTPYVFYLDSIGAALTASWVAKNLLAQREANG